MLQVENILSIKQHVISINQLHSLVCLNFACLVVKDRLVWIIAPETYSAYRHHMQQQQINRNPQSKKWHFFLEWEGKIYYPVLILLQDLYRVASSFSLI
jgi:hypothetical protein